MSTQPSLIGKIAGFLELEREHSLLEIGCGSGYQCAVLSKLCDRVVALERYRTLADLARDRIRSAKLPMRILCMLMAWPQLLMRARMMALLTAFCLRVF